VIFNATIFQLYHGGQFYWWKKPEEKIIIPEINQKCRPITNLEQTGYDFVGYI
jgi:hypothetical protein